MSNHNGRGDNAPHQPPDQDTTQRYKVGYKWRMGYRDDDGFYSAGRWHKATVIVEVPSFLHIVTYAEKRISEMHPYCETKITHHLGRVAAASQTGGAS